MTDGGAEARGTEAADRRERLRRLLEERAARRYPLSPQQERLWVAHQLDPADPSHNLRTAVEIRGDVDPSMLGGAVDRLVERHEQLRARFPTRDGEPITEIAPRSETAPERLEAAATAGEEEIAALLAGVAARPFDLERGPLLRWALLELDERRLIFLFVVHHIVCDAWSMNLLLRELVELVAAERAGRQGDLPSLDASYAEFAGAQRDLLEGGARPELEAYWRQSLAGVRPAALTGGAAPPRGSRVARRRSFVLDAALTDRLRRSSHRHGATLNMLLLAGFAALLHRRFAPPELVVTIPVANRQHETWEGLVGYFVNLLPLRIDCSRVADFADLLDTVRSRLVAAHDHQELPVHRIAEIAGVRQAALLEVLFQHAGGKSDPPVVPGLELSIRGVDVARSRTRLALSTHLDGDRLAGTLEYDTDSFTATEVDRLVGDLERVLGRIGEDDAVPLEELPVSERAVSERAVSERAVSERAVSEEAVSEAPGSERIGSERIAAQPARRGSDAEPSGASPGPAAGSALGRLTAIWSRVLSVEDLQPLDNFLDVGGDSLAALQIIERVEDELGVRLAPGDLFTQTLAQLAAQCEKRRD